MSISFLDGREVTDGGPLHLLLHPTSLSPTSISSHSLSSPSHHHHIVYHLLAPHPYSFFTTALAFPSVNSSRYLGRDARMLVTRWGCRRTSVGREKFRFLTFDNLCWKYVHVLPMFFFCIFTFFCFLVLHRFLLFLLSISFISQHPFSQTQPSSVFPNTAAAAPHNTSFPGTKAELWRKTILLRLNARRPPLRLGPLLMLVNTLEASVIATSKQTSHIV